VLRIPSIPAALADKKEYKSLSKKSHGSRKRMALPFNIATIEGYHNTYTRLKKISFKYDFRFFMLEL
jgi:hypothetical protein